MNSDLLIPMHVHINRLTFKMMFENEDGVRSFREISLYHHSKLYRVYKIHSLPLC